MQQFDSILKFPDMVKKWGMVAFSLLLIGLAGCGDGEKVEEVPLDEIQLELDVARPDLAMHAAAVAFRQDSNQTNRAVYDAHLKPFRTFFTDYLYMGQDSLATDSFISEDLGDYFRNPNFAELLDSVVAHYPADYDLEGKLTKPFKRFRYYFPHKPIPTIRTAVSGYLPSAQAGTDEIFFAPPMMVLGLHYYMGKNWPYYPADLPDYAKRRYSEPYLTVLPFKSLADRMLPPANPVSHPRLIDNMIHKGKKLYFLEKILPFTADSLLIEYSAAQMHWAEVYEARIYNELLPSLYSNDHFIQQDYLDPAPYTTNLSRESAPRIGEFCGWQIVRAYMERHPEMTLDELFLDLDFDRILRDSKYRPRE